jgi:hypothetical protein
MLEQVKLEEGKKAADAAQQKKLQEQQALEFAKRDEQQRLFAAAQRKRADAEEQKRRAAEEQETEDAMRAPFLGSEGAPQVEGFWLHNASREMFNFQLLTPKGWSNRSLTPGTKQFYSANYQEKLRWKDKEGGFHLEPLTVFVQPYYSFSGYNLESVKRSAPMHRISSAGTGAFQIGQD